MRVYCRLAASIIQHVTVLFHLGRLNDEEKGPCPKTQYTLSTNKHSGAWTTNLWATCLTSMTTDPCTEANDIILKEYKYIKKDFVSIFLQ